MADDATRKQVKKKELDKPLYAFFLHNANHDRFGEILVEYRKAYANKDVKYPQDLSSMMDVVRQQPLKKKKKDPVKTPEKEKDTDKEGEGESSYSTMKDGKGDYNCFCCGSNKCQLHHFPNKMNLPLDQ